MTIRFVLPCWLKPLLICLLLFGFPCLANSQSPTAFQKTQQALANPADTTVLVAAHRGGYSKDRQNKAPENSITNLELAVSKGFHVYETDIRQTSDGVFVIVHDATLDRETNGTGPVEKMKAADVNRLRKKFRDGSLSGQTVATLDAMLAAGKGKIYFKADLKPGVIESFDQLAKLIHKHKVADQVFLRTEFRHLWAIEKLFASGTPRVEVMLKVNSADQVEKVQKRLAPKTIQINIQKDEKLSKDKLEAIKAAKRHSILIETHIYNDDEQTEDLIKAGVRMFHTTKPEAAMKYLLNRTADSSESTKRPVDKPKSKK